MRIRGDSDKTSNPLVIEETVFYFCTSSVINIRGDILKKIVTITGHMNTDKVSIAQKLAKNSDVQFIKPYCGMDMPMGIEPHENEYLNFVLPPVLEDMKRDENVLFITEIKNREYVVFEFQMVSNYNVIVVDDEALKSLHENWDGEIYSIFVRSKNQKTSERVEKLFTPHGFDEIFDADEGDIDELEARIV